MKIRTIIRLFFLLAIISTIPLKSDAQQSFKSWITKKKNDNVAQVTVWRYNLNKGSVNKEGLLQIDTLYKFDTTIIGDMSRIDTTMVIRETYPRSDYFEYPDTCIKIKKVYSENGLLVYEEGFFSGIDQPLYLYKRYTYDNKNRLIEEVEYNKDSTHIEKINTAFDDNKMAIRRVQFLNGNRRHFVIYKYNKEGQLLMQTMFLKDSIIDLKVTYEYLSKEEMKFNSFFKEDSMPNGFSYIKFDKRGNKIESLHYNNDSTFFSGYSFTYNEKGKLIQKKWLVDKAKNTAKNIEYELDNNGNTITIKNLENNSIIERLYYNKEDLLDHEIFYDQDGNPVYKLYYDYVYLK